MCALREFVVERQQRLKIIVECFVMNEREQTKHGCRAGRLFALFNEGENVQRSRERIKSSAVDLLTVSHFLAELCAENDTHPFDRTM